MVEPNPPTPFSPGGDRPHREGGVIVRPRTRERGQSIVEAALLAPVLLLLFLMVGDFGRVFYSYIAVVSAARAGAESAANSATPDSTVVSVATQEANGVVPVTVSVSSYCGASECPPRAPGKLAKVTVTGSYRPLSPLIATALGPLLTAGALPLRRDAWAAVY